MDRFPNYARQPYGTAMSTRAQRSTRSNVNYKEPDIHDDRGSLSGSDDGNYPSFHDSGKLEGDHEKGADLVLTSQTLNADGTPKRPMNAFMIFARRRRPQVSSENQSMRTGEISKLLSKEWSSMPAADKQFYQDQAKLLKDSFNTKYPDYVYRRRPNNSRRRRRSDAVRPDGAGEGEDGASAAGDFESPTDGDEHLDGGGEPPYSRSSNDPPSYGDALKYPATSSIPRSSFQPSHSLYRGSDSRLPYPPPSERHGHGLSHRLSNPSLNYSLSSSSSNYSSDLGSPQTWHPRLDRGPTGWSSGQSRGLPALKTGNYPGSSAGSGWSSGLGSSSSSNNFPTLNTPFFPSQSSMAEYSNLSNSSTGNAHYDSSLSLQPLERPSGYDSRGNSLSEPLTYPASRGLSRVLPPVASISGYPSHLSATSPSISSTQYWSRS